MTADLILEELHQVREQFAAWFNYDVATMVAFLREQQQLEKDHPVVSFAKPRNDAEEPATDTTQQRAA